MIVLAILVGRLLQRASPFRTPGLEGEEKAWLLLVEPMVEFGSCIKTGLFAHALAFAPLEVGLCLLLFFMTSVALKTVAKPTELDSRMAELLGSPNVPSLLILA